MEEEENNSPFNMGIETLKSIRNLIDHITELSVMAVEGNPKQQGEQQHAKWKFVKQLTVISRPLLKLEQHTKIMTEFRKIKLANGFIGGGRGQPNIPAVVYDFLVDDNLDSIVILVQEELQEHEHFMPVEEEEEDEEE